MAKQTLGEKTQNEMENSRKAMGQVKQDIKHIDLYKFPAGQKSGGSKKSVVSKIC